MGNKLTSEFHPQIVKKPEPALAEALFTWRSEEDTQIFAQRLAASMMADPRLANSFFELRGDLGAGKTTFTRHLLRALGVTGRIKSPSYAVVEPHQAAGLSIWHFDFYRFNDPREWADAGFRDLFASSGLKLAEWPENAQGVLPTPDWVVQIGMAPFETQDPDDSVTPPRQVLVKALTERGQALLKSVVTP